MAYPRYCPFGNGTEDWVGCYMGIGRFSCSAALLYEAGYIVLSTGTADYSDDGVA
jgi:hypothetical protein